MKDLIGIFAACLIGVFSLIGIAIRVAMWREG
jgi:hypothetical protein